MLGPAEEQRHCWLCERPTAPEALFPLDLPDVEGSHGVCRPCREDVEQQGRRLEPFEPRFRPGLGYRWTTSLALDARALRREALLALGRPTPADEAPGRDEARRALEPLRARLFPSGAVAGRTDEAELLDALWLAVAAEEELAPFRQVERAASTASDETGALVGVYAHQQARVRLARLTSELMPLVAAGPATSDLDPRRLAGELWLRVDGAARLVFERDRAIWDLLEAARMAYTMVLPGSPRALATPLQARVAVLRATLLIERGDLRPGQNERAAPAREPDALERAQDWLRGCHERAAAPDAPPGLRDPRLPLLRALVEGLRGNAAGLHGLLDEAAARVEAWPDRAEREALELVVQRDRYARFAHVQLLDDKALAALRRCLALRPGDPTFLLELGRVYLRRAQPGVAREVLERRLGRREVDDSLIDREVHDTLAEARTELERLRQGDPGDLDARLHHAACLARLGEVREALAALDHEALLEDARHGTATPRQAESLHLAGRCAWELGREEEATELLAAAWAVGAHEDARRARRALMHVLFMRLRERVAAIASDADPEPWRAPSEEEVDPDGAAVRPTRELVRAALEVLTPHAAALRDELAGGAADVLWSFLLVELSTPEDRGQLRAQEVPMLAEMADVGFGPSRLDTALGATAVASTFLACRALHARRLPEAVRQDRRARDAGGPPVPIDLLLRALAIVRAGGEPARREALAAVVAVIGASGG